MSSSIRSLNLNVSPRRKRSRNLLERFCGFWNCLKVPLSANATFLDAFALFRYVMIYFVLKFNIFVPIFSFIEIVIFLEMLVVRFLGYSPSHWVQAVWFLILCHYRKLNHHLFPSVLDHSVCYGTLLMVLFYFDQSVIKHFIFLSEPPSVFSMSFSLIWK